MCDRKGEKARKDEAKKIFLKIKCIPLIDYLWVKNISIIFCSDSGRAMRIISGGDAPD